MAPTDLSGSWRAAPADDDLRRTFAAPDLDDDGWESIEVPGHWRSTPAFDQHDGGVFHRTGFATSAPGDRTRTWLRLEGVFYQSDVWLDGDYIGDTEGYFFGHTFEVSEQVAARREHVLAVEAVCQAEPDRTAKRNLTGVFQHFDMGDPDWNPGGIWRPVVLEETGPLRLRRLSVVCTEANEESAVIRISGVVDTLDAGSCEAVTTVGDRVEHVEPMPLAAGANAIEWDVRVDEPDLWWPRSLGDQPLSDVTVALRTADGATSHAQTRRIGLRAVDLRNWILSVNGERIFVKGANLGPTRMALAEASPAELERDVALAVDAGLDLLRLHAHITRPELYAAADEAGMLLWQDFPLQWGYARTVRRQAVRQSRKAVETLGHHPSVVIWCGHNEPVGLDIEPGSIRDEDDLRRLMPRMVAAQQLPSWNKTVLDRSVRRAIDGADGSRPVIPHSGVAPHLPKLDGTDSHLYFGWYHGEARDLSGFTARLPRMARFVSEFGAQAVPDSAEFCEPERWPELDWERLERHHGLQRFAFERYVPPGDHATFDDWREATQRYQAELIKHHVEHLRRLKYRPTGGFAQFCLTDGHPGISWSVLDHERRPKLGYQALREACRPVIIVADRLPASPRPGDTLDLAVHAVSDLRHPLPGARVTGTVRWDGGERTWEWGGDLPPDRCVQIGVVDGRLPDDARGELVLELALEADGAEATNRYRTVIDTTG